MSEKRNPNPVPKSTPPQRRDIPQPQPGTQRKDLQFPVPAPPKKK